MKRTLGILLAIYGLVVLLMVSGQKLENNNSSKTMTRITMIK